MRGFSTEWADVPDFILGITKRIWEDREIASLGGIYAPGLVVRSAGSLLVDSTAVVAATLATLAEFPDRELLGEDVIWCPDPAGSDGEGDAYLSSHRLLCTATHLGPGMYGAPTRRPLRYRILADCWIKGDQVRDEWLVRDQGAVVRQMGLDVVEWTRDLIRREGGPERCVRPFAPILDRPGPYLGRGDDSPEGARLAGVLRRIMDADLAVIPAEYDRACELHGPGHVEAHGREAADRFWLGLRSALPSGAFAIHHATGRRDAAMPPRAAVRWSLDGTHDGWGAFGRPTGAPVHVMGITHAEFGPRGLRREWTLIDETAVWKQILLATGDV